MPSQGGTGFNSADNFLGCRGPATSSRSGAPKLSAYIPSIRSVSSSVSASNSLSRARREAPLILGEEFAQELDLGGRHVDQLLHCSVEGVDRKSTRLNSSHYSASRMPSS